MHQRHLPFVGFQSLASNFERLGVPVQTDQSALAAHLLQNLKRVSTQAHRRVYVRSAGPNRQPVDGLFGQHRRVQRTQTFIQT